MGPETLSLLLCAAACAPPGSADRARAGWPERGLGVAQVEAFHDLHVAELHGGNHRREESASSLFKDRLFLGALVLHSADLSNAVKPMSIVDKRAPTPPSAPPKPLLGRAPAAGGLAGAVAEN